MILVGWSELLVLRKDLVIPPFYGLASSGCMIYQVRPILVVEAAGCHGAAVVRDSPQVEEVDTFLSDSIVLPDFIEHPL